MMKFIRLGALVGYFGGVTAIAALYLRHHNIPVLQPRGTIATQERNLIVIAVLISLAVVVPVFALLIGFAVRYREGNKKARYMPEFTGSNAYELVWWLIPTAIIVVLSVITWVGSHRLDPYKPLNSSVKPITIQVVALDWKWLFIYPDQHVASVNSFQIPVNTPINFQITSDAPMNSFWVPALGGQVYAMPGMSTQLHLMASKTGDYRGSSANISGIGFAGMTFTAHAGSNTDFTNWVTHIKKTDRALTTTEYTKLAKQSSNVKPIYYSQPADNLYDDTVMKYMMPMDDMPSDSNGSAQPMTTQQNAPAGQMPGMAM